jgi:meiotic recombination protein REC8, fungi type
MPDADAGAPIMSDGRAAVVPEDGPVQVTSEETAEAPLRRRARPAPRAVPFDRTMELHNSDLARWNNEYVTNMNDAIRLKNAVRATTIAKKNAEFWMLTPSTQGPLGIFSGVQLLEALTGRTLPSSGEKRQREDDNSSDHDRRVRSRGELSSDEIGRAAQEDDFMPIMGDETIEQGREAPTPLDDRHLSSMMPWNQSAGSRRPTALFSGVNQPTSASMGGPLDAVARRRSRLTSASPLMGRGVMAGDLDDFQLGGSQIDIGMTAGDDFELFGPAAGVDTQTAAQSQWQRAVLDSESDHFLEFVQAGIKEMNEARATALVGDEEDETSQGTIDFDTLLPPNSHTSIVAAQALLHVLTLATRNLLSVGQEEAYGPITMQVVARA